MPSTTNTGTKRAPKQQAPKPSTAPTPTQDAAPAAIEPTPPPAVSPESLFDDVQSEPPAAEPSPGEPAAPSEASADGRPEGAEGEQEATPPADPEPVVEPNAPAAEEQPTPEAPAEEPRAPEPAAAPTPDPVAAPKVDVGQSFAEPETVRLGAVTGFLHRMPLGDVLAYAEDFAVKIDALTYSAEVQALQPRMRATEGRCAPIYFTGDDDGEPEFLLDGDRALSAAIALGLETVSVIVIRPGDAGAAQAYLASEASKTTSTTSEDDFLLQVNAYHAENQPASPA